MAEFCYYCIQDIDLGISAKKNGLRHDNDQPIQLTCERCGTGLFHSDGKPVRLKIAHYSLTSLYDLHFNEENPEAKQKLVGILKDREKDPPSKFESKGYVAYLDESDEPSIRQIFRGYEWYGCGCYIRKPHWY